MEAWEKRHADQVYPVFYVAKDLHAPRVTLKAGTLWDPQDRRGIRGWSEAFGVKDDGRPWHELPFVTTVVAPTWDVANEIVSRGMRLDEAETYVAQWLEANAESAA
jgi:hypothetical protein